MGVGGIGDHAGVVGGCAARNDDVGAGFADGSGDQQGDGGTEEGASSHFAYSLDLHYLCKDKKEKDKDEKISAFDGRSSVGGRHFSGHVAGRIRADAAAAGGDDPGDGEEIQGVHRRGDPPP
jgi:hypothetical protein